MISLLIIDDNPRFASALAAAFESTGEFGECATLNDAFQALTRFESSPPDVAIIDMLMPRMDGAELLTLFRERKLASATKLIAISPLVNDEIVRMAQNLNVIYFIAMPMDPDLIVRRVLNIIGIDITRQATPHGERAKHRDVSREQIISNYLRASGIPAHYKGYLYLKCAIDFVAENYGKNLGVTTDVYPEVARVFKTNPKLVERSIRHALDVAWYKGDIDAQHKLFGYTVNDKKGRPTNKECIAMLADRTMMRMKYR